MPRILAIVTFILFSLIGIAALLKNKNPAPTIEKEPLPVEITLEWETNSSSPTSAPIQPLPDPIIKPTTAPKEEKEITKEASQNEQSKPTDDLPYAARIDEFFNTRDPRFPFVKTITYKSRVSWQHGRPAWIADYASHYRTSRHFIARSLNGKPEYEKQDVGNGDRFNILDPDTEITFHLVIDTSRCKLWFYVEDQTRHQLTLVKVYEVGLGRLDPSKKSGSLTPHGTYALGDQVAIYKKETKGNYQGNAIEMIRVFGTRWIPLTKSTDAKLTHKVSAHEITESPKGYGIHGAPWKEDPDTNRLMECTECIGKHESDGCIRLLSQDIEELFSIIISRPTVVEIVADFKDSQIYQREKP